MGSSRNWLRRINDCDTLLRRQRNDPDNTTINSEVYCNQRDKLSDALKEKIPELANRKGVVFHQDNARPHTSLITRQKLLQLEWDVLPTIFSRLSYFGLLLIPISTEFFEW